MSRNFVHLNLRSEYSILDSIVQVKPLCQEVKNQGMPAVAITDICNVFGMVKFYKEAISKGIKPIIGAQLWLENHKIVLLCQNTHGYKNLSKIISKAYQEGEHQKAPIVLKSWIKEYQEGLIALSGAQFGDVGCALVQSDLHKAAQLLKEWMEIFHGRFYLEIQRNNRVNQRAYESNLFALANDLHCPVVATNEVVFLKKSDFDAHKARVCIQEGTMLEHNTSDYTPEQYFKSTQEMWEIFKDIPHALENSVEISKRCSLELTLDVSILPSFPVPEGLTVETYLQKASIEGLQNRFNLKPKDENAKALYTERLRSELSVINSMGFAGYFLIVADFIQWAKSNCIPVGPGRGSGAGSLVAYALSITDLDPIEYDLLFERFLNPERVSMPDFDIDFCMDGRDRVIEYVSNRYGRENVSQIATFGTMAAKAVIRDVGRVLGHPYGFVDKIAKLIPFEIGITLEKALQQEQILNKRYQEEDEVRNLIDLAKKLEGITRNVGKHAGGVVIAPSNLTEFAPLYCEKESLQAVIQFDKDDVEAIGLTKFDFLGLRTLTIIDWAIRNVNQLLIKKGEPLIDIQLIPLNDPNTFTLLKKCATTAVFQLESRGMKELIKRLQPDEFEEIIALVALFRPGPLQSGMVDDFINRKHGRQRVEYLHPDIEPILKPTYGVILYQEQVMQIAQVLAGYTLGGADLLRRAMGKKKPEEMAKQRTIFLEGAIKRGVNERIANTIFDLMEKFAGYGFNKSHSAAYALVSYQTAWLKAHFPSPFMAAVLSADMNHTDKIVNMIDECKQCQITVISPDIHYSEYAFTVNNNNEIVYGLGAIKGVGENAISHIIAERKRGKFKSLFDFCERVDHRKVNKRVIESLIKSGSFDTFGHDRAVLMSMMDEAMARAEQFSKNATMGQPDLFQGMDDLDPTPKRDFAVINWSTEQRLEGEKESLGLYLSGHPLEELEPEFAKMGIIKFNQIKQTKKDHKFLISGLIVSIRTMQTKNGDRMAIIMLDDRLDRFEVTVFPEPFQKFRDALIKDALVIIEGVASIDNYTGGLRVRANSVYTYDAAMETFAKRIHIRLSSEAVSDEKVKALQACLSNQARGDCQLYIQYPHKNADISIKLDPKWNVKLSKDCLIKIKESIIDATVEVEY